MNQILRLRLQTIKHLSNMPCKTPLIETLMTFFDGDPTLLAYFLFRGKAFCKEELDPTTLKHLNP